MLVLAAELSNALLYLLNASGIFRVQCAGQFQALGPPATIVSTRTRSPGATRSIAGNRAV